MPKGVARKDLPQKICLTCGRAFVWRKKWARDWSEVRYCSAKCRAAAPGTKAGSKPKARLVN